MRAHYSLVFSPKEFGGGQEDGNGSIGRGELGCLLSWRAHEGLGPCYRTICSKDKRLEV